MRSPVGFVSRFPDVDLSADGGRATLVWVRGTTGAVVQSSSAIITATGITAPPGPPMLPTATPGDRQAIVTFTAPGDRGSAITDYEYSVGGGSWTSGGTTTSPVTVTGLTNDTTVSLRVRAVNANGPGLPSDAVTVTPTLPPPVPGVLTWSAPTWASLVTQYQVRYRPLGSSPGWDTYAARTTAWPGAVPTQLQLDATVGDCQSANSAVGWDSCPLPAGSMTPGTTYEFSVFARTGTGLGAASDTVQYVAPGPGESGADPSITGGWGPDPNPSPSPSPSLSPSPSPSPSGGTGQSPTPTPSPSVTQSPTASPPVPPDMRNAKVRKLRLVRGVARWKAPTSAPTARFQVRAKRASWSTWRDVGLRTKHRVGRKAVAVKVRAVLPAGTGPAVVVRKARR